MDQSPLVGERNMEQGAGSSDDDAQAVALHVDEANVQGQGRDESVYDAYDEQQHVRDERFETLRQASREELLPLVRDGKLAAIGGVLKEEPWCFNVDEINEPAHLEEHADGQFCYVRIRRSGQDTFHVAHRLKKLLSVDKNDLTFCGLKDKNACTTQLFCVNVIPPGCVQKDRLNPTSIAELIRADTDSPKLEVLECRFGRKRLKPGYLLGNRFRILVTELGCDLDQAYERALKIKADLANKGVPNYFGIQRIGQNAKGVLEGYRLVRWAEKFVEEKTAAKIEGGGGDQSSKSTAGQSSSEEPPLKKQKKENTRGAQFNKRDFWKWLKKQKANVSAFRSSKEEFKLHAFQSGLFNWLLAHRVSNGKFSEDVIGDFIKTEADEKVRFIDDPTQLTSPEERNDGKAFTLPLVGSCMKPRDDTESGRLEIGAWQSLGLDINFAALALYPDYVSLTKRIARLSVSKMGMQITKVPSIADYFESNGSGSVGVDSTFCEGPALLFEFSLPSGSYATSVLREFMMEPGQQQ